MVQEGRGLLSKIVDAWREGGLFEVLERSLRKIWILTGLDFPVRQRGTWFYHDTLWFDYFWPFSDPGYEIGTAKALEREVLPDDKVVVVGGGRGFTACHAKRWMLGVDVTVFEASKEYVAEVEKAAELNDVSLDIRHCMVGEPVKVFGELGDPDVIPPGDLPECDVLEMDCEGSEIGILKYMDIMPRAIIVESHGHYGAPSSKVKELLKGRGYRIVSEEWEGTGGHAHARECDIKVITGRRF